MTDPSEVRDTPRDAHGRFVPIACPDPNCSGVLVFEPLFDGVHAHGFGAARRQKGVWRCDGLTYDNGNAEASLDACGYQID